MVFFTNALSLILIKICPLLYIVGSIKILEYTLFIIQHISFKVKKVKFYYVFKNKKITLEVYEYYLNVILIFLVIVVYKYSNVAETRLVLEIIILSVWTILKYIAFLLINMYNVIDNESCK